MKKYKTVVFALVIIIGIMFIYFNSVSTFQKELGCKASDIKEINVMYDNDVYETKDMNAILEVYDYLNQFKYKFLPENGFSGESLETLYMVIIKSSGREYPILISGNNIRLGVMHYCVENSSVDIEKIIKIMND